MTVLALDKKWWKEAVIYQIYPASFCDSNGDGIGDLDGIASKLDYLAALGVDALWICPMYASPQVDMGYDIADYEAVHAPYGTLADMQALIEATHARGMRILLDLVINHTSDQHAWFRASRAARDDNPKRDWYIWRPARRSPSGERLPPNNWRCVFGGGSAWQWDEHTGEYYLHLFAAEQPDVNWENEAARRAVYASAMTFWLDRGVDGFRVDAANLYSKPPGLPDAPVTEPGAAFQPALAVCANGPRVHEFLAEIKAVVSRYGAVTVGELPSTPDVAAVLRYVSARAGQLDMVLQFDAVDCGLGTAAHKYDTTPRGHALPALKSAIGRIQSVMRDTDGWTTVFLENHDQARSVSRFADDAAPVRVPAAKMLALMQACLSGTQLVYQGQEIGCVNAPRATYPLDNYLDLDTALFLDMVRQRHGADDEAALDRAEAALAHLARDHARIPMAWNGAARYGGFSEAAESRGEPVREPWMKPHPLAAEINVAAQMDDPDSVLAFWRNVIAFRKEHAHLLVYGHFRDLRPDDADLFVFVKEPARGGDKMLVVLNFTARAKTWRRPSAEELRLGAVSLEPLLSTCGEGKPHDDDDGELAPFEGRVYLARE